MADDDDDRMDDDRLEILRELQRRGFESMKRRSSDQDRLELAGRVLRGSIERAIADGDGEALGAIRDQLRSSLPMVRAVLEDKGVPPELIEGIMAGTLMMEADGTTVIVMGPDGVWSG